MQQNPAPLRHPAQSHGLYPGQAGTNCPKAGPGQCPQGGGGSWGTETPLWPELFLLSALGGGCSGALGLPLSQENLSQVPRVPRPPGATTLEHALLGAGNLLKPYGKAPTALQAPNQPQQEGPAQMSAAPNGAGSPAAGLRGRPQGSQPPYPSLRCLLRPRATYEPTGPLPCPQDPLMPRIPARAHGSLPTPPGSSPALHAHRYLAARYPSASVTPVPCPWGPDTLQGSLAVMECPGPRPQAPAGHAAPSRDSLGVPRGLSCTSHLPRVQIATSGSG